MGPVSRPVDCCPDGNSFQIGSRNFRVFRNPERHVQADGDGDDVRAFAARHSQVGLRRSEHGRHQVRWRQEGNSRSQIHLENKVTFFRLILLTLMK